jgi:type IV pilus assembly protein PilV
MSTPRHHAARGQHGGMLIEVLVSILICAFGLLGFVALQARASTAEFESYQRSQALVLLEDMTHRLNANRGQATSYVTNGLIGAGDLADCSGLAGAPLDLCEWSNLLRGSAETRSGANTGAMVGARGCITRAADSTDRYVVSIAWVGIVPTGAPASTCGQGDTAFADERLRRVVSSTVCVALLRDPATPLALPRC